MLVLTRNLNQSIIIGDDVTVTILSINGKQVRIGIEAPNEIGVHREEIFNKIKSEQGATRRDLAETT